MRDEVLKICLNDFNHVGKPANLQRIHWIYNQTKPNVINCYVNEAIFKMESQPLSIGWISEPPEISDIYQRLNKMEHKFKYIFTFCDSFLRNNPDKYKVFL